jgi:putative ABC transport system permease protein
MSLIDSLRYRWRVLTRSRDHETELAEDMEFFVRSAASDEVHASHGAMGDDDARRAVRRRFGNSTYYREEARRVSGLALLDELGQDVRFALRTFARTRTFTAIAVSTLAIGIGANTAIFSAIDTLLLRPLPFREPDRLMNIALSVPTTSRGPGRDDLVWSYPKIEAFRAAQNVFGDLTAWFGMQFTVRVGDEAERISGEFIDSRYFPTLGIAPVLGRAMLRSEDHLGGPRVVVISDALWRGIFNADPSVLGRALDIDGTIFTIIGVAPAEFNGVSGIARFWIPFVNPPAAWGAANLLTDNHTFFLIGRLAPNVTAERAASISRDIGPRIDAQFPDRGPNARRWGIAAHSLDQTRVDDGVRRTLAMLFAAVAMVLLVACANVASLFLVRAASRRHEIAVRLAIGASRSRLVRQLLVESVLLALLGGIASLAVAWVGTNVIYAARPVLWGGQSASGIGTVTVDPIRLDVVALAFTGAIAIATGILFGLIPAIHSTRPTLTDSLRVEGGSSTRSPIARRMSMRDVLTILEIALAVVLLAGSGVLVRTLANLVDIRPGFEPSGVLTMRVNRAPAWSRDSITLFYDVAVARLRSVPGVTHVALADCAPQGGACSGSEFLFPDRPGAAPMGAGLHWVTSDWNAAMHVPLVRGRLIEPTDRKGTPFVVLVSETAARAFWPGDDALGKRLALDHGDTARVVGVVGDVRFRGIQSTPRPEVYMSYYQQPMSYRMMLHLRTSGDPGAIAEAARRALREVAPGFPIYDVATLEQRIGGALGEAKFLAQLLSLFAVLALVLATIGTYGVISYAVAQRTREMGVRIALGATARDVIRLVVGQGVALALVGGSIGLAGAIAATRAIRTRLYDVPPADPVTLVGIVLLLALAVLAASWLPARRAASVPAVQALRGG